jgi:ketosteroid isomerase-like protein
MTDAETAVLTAANALIAAFGSHDVEAYFASFDPDTTFIFYNSPAVLHSVAEYQALWSEWETDGFHVDACASLDQHVQFLTSDVALFTHRVNTTVSDHSGQASLDERESIVFRRQSNEAWIAVHEHLSSYPEKHGAAT